VGSKSASPKISGKTIEEIRKSTELAIQQLWNQINGLIDRTSKSDIGEKTQESQEKGIRLVQTKDKYYLEARFKDGWARLTDATGFKILTKKD
jgi:hypothetical protein